MLKTFHQSCWFGLVGFVLVLDQMTKYLSQQFLVLHEPIAIFPGFQLFLAYNHGAAFSFLADGSGWQRWLFVLIAIVLCTLMIYWFKQHHESEKAEKFSLALILGGAFGNLIDRLVHGYVIDFIDVYYGAYHWPTFNIADSAICLGAALYLWVTIRK